MAEKTGAIYSESIVLETFVSAIFTSTEMPNCLFFNLRIYHEMWKVRKNV